MKIKRFFAKDMRTALNEVKVVLGPDAVIMSNTKTSEGVEIVAAIDNDNDAAVQPQTTQPAPSVNNPSVAAHPYGDNSAAAPNFRPSANPNASFNAAEANQAFSQDMDEEQVADSLKALLERQHSKLHEENAFDLPKKAMRNSNSYNPNQNKDRETFSNASAGDAYNPRPLQPNTSVDSNNHVGNTENSVDKAEISAMKNEMSELRKLMEHQVSGLMWQEMARREPVRAFLVDRFNKLGIANEVADQVASFIPEELTQHEAWKHGLELLAGQVNVTNNDILRRGGVVALLGPTGVGKTTTIAKLAAHFAQQHGSDQVAMVTTDTFRIGAHEQLQTYAKILGCPCKVVKDQQELTETLYQLRGRKLVLVDTAGVGQRDIRLAEHLDTLMRANNVKIRSYLVLQSTAQRRVMQEAIDQFRRIPITGCIFTKVDECISLGEILSVAIQNALPIAYLSEGQRVPEDIRAAESGYLVEKAAQLMGERNISQPNWFTDDSLQPINK